MNLDPLSFLIGDERDAALLRVLRRALATSRASPFAGRDMVDEDVPTLYFGPALTMRAFTRAAGPLFHVSASDIGKSVAEIAAAIRDPWLFDDSRAVIAAHGSIAREVRRDGLWRLRRLTPACTPHGDAEGVVVTSVDIDQRKRARDALAAAERGEADFAEMAGEALALCFARGRTDAAADLFDAKDANARIAALSPRQRQIMTHVVDGRPNKVIAFQLGLSVRTVENHRAALMRRLGVRSLPALVRLALAARAASGRWAARIEL